MRENGWLVLVLLLLLLAGGGVVYTMTRGLRNNNPGNLRRTGDQWKGLTLEQTDPVFFQFVRPEDGIRAMTITLNNYRRLYGRNTIRKIITRYAPANENDLEAYIADVAGYTGIDPDQELSDSDMPMLVTAIIRHENGVQPYTLAFIEQSMALA